MAYVSHLLALAGIYAIAVVSLDLLISHAGLLSLAHVGFMLVGAYGYARFTMDLGLHWAFALRLVVAIGALCGMLLALVTRGLRGEPFVLATFGTHLLVVALAQAWVPITGGSAGLAAVPGISGGSVAPAQAAPVFWVCAVLQWLIAQRLISSPLGRLTHVFRENETLLQITGFNPESVRLRVLAIAGGGAALSGALYAGYVRYIEPLTFNLFDSVMLVAALVIGGLGSPLGNIVGVFLLVAVPEVLRTLGLPAVVAAELRQFLFGGILVLVILFRPAGLFGEQRLVRKLLS